MSWQRVESSTIDPDLDDGLAARVADPYWLLARQWQVGEFRGEDAANPFFVEIEAESLDVDLLQLGAPAGGGPIAIRGEDARPLEAAVEAEQILESQGAARLSAETAHLLTQQLIANPSIGARPTATVLEALREAYPLTSPDDGADPVGRRRLRVLARHTFDAAALVLDVIERPADVERWAAEIDIGAGARAAVNKELVAWARQLAELFVAPMGSGAWNPSRMEYEFSAGASLGLAGGGIGLVARDYGGGRLDWFNFDWLGARLPSRPDMPNKVHEHSSELLPKPLTYAGMPASRFWEFEDGTVYFGGMDAAPEDLGRVALAAYATVYGDDWYVVPLTLPAGRLANVTKVVVHDDFGGVTEIPAAAVLDGPGRPFRWFEITGDPSPGLGRAPILFVPPTVETTDAGRPLDDVRMTRDEAANLAWAVEHRVEGIYGRAVDPRLHVAATPVAEVDPDSDDDVWMFTLAGQVPSNWVPLVPVRLGANGAMGLQRGRMPVPGTSETRGAHSQLMEPDDRLVIEESEVPRAGLRVLRRFQSARSSNGGLHVWLGRQKGPGRGEAESGFVFDALDLGEQRDGEQRDTV